MSGCEGGCVILSFKQEGDNGEASSPRKGRKRTASAPQKPAKKRVVRKILQDSEEQSASDQPATQVQYHSLHVEIVRYPLLCAGFWCWRH